MCLIRRCVLTAKSESVKSTVDEVYSWASQLASESRNPDWVTGWYVLPQTVVWVHHQLETMKAEIMGPVALQFVGLVVREHPHTRNASPAGWG